jgi:hypothetical protein
MKDADAQRISLNSVKFRSLNIERWNYKSKWFENQEQGFHSQAVCLA